MPELTADDILRKIDVPFNAWRKKDEKGKEVCKERAMVFIEFLRKYKVPIDDIQTMIADLYWDAVLEHELQVKETAGKSVKEFFIAKFKSEEESKLKEASTTQQTS